MHGKNYKFTELFKLPAIKMKEFNLILICKHIFFN